MSKVYGFRLDENHPREAQAREVIEACVSKGYSMRQLITAALISYGSNNIQGFDVNTIAEQIIEFLKKSAIGQATNFLEHTDKEILSTKFIDAVKISAKAGTKEN